MSEETSSLSRFVGPFVKKKRGSCPEPKVVTISPSGAFGHVSKKRSLSALRRRCVQQQSLVSGRGPLGSVRQNSVCSALLCASSKHTFMRLVELVAGLLQPVALALKYWTCQGALDASPRTLTSIMILPPALNAADLPRALRWR